MGELADQRRSSVASFCKIGDTLVGSDVQDVEDFEMEPAWLREFDNALSKASAPTVTQNVGTTQNNLE